MTMLFFLLSIIFFLVWGFVYKNFGKRYRERIFSKSSDNKRKPKGLEVGCSECRIPCKLFIPRYEYNCPTHGWFRIGLLAEEKTRMKSNLCLTCGTTNEEDTANCYVCGHKLDKQVEIAQPSPPYLEELFETLILREDPIEGDPSELDSSQSDDPVFCNFMTRKNTLCNVSVDDTNPCGYHNSSVQIVKESNLKHTIMQIYNEATGQTYPLPEDYLNDDIPAYDLLYALFSHTINFKD